MLDNTESCICNLLHYSKAPWLNADCFVVITGACRGYGKALCLELVKAMSSDSNSAASLTIFLMSPNLDALNVTKSEMLKYKSNNSSLELDIILTPISVDLSKADKALFCESLKSFFTKHDICSKTKAKPQWNLLINNAATVGTILQRADERIDINVLNDYYHLNLTSMIVLIGVFIDHFAPLSNSKHEPVTIVNISSLTAIKPFSLMADYCAGKAAREMYLKCLSVDRPSIAVFNYSPGPLNTDMFRNIIEKHGNPVHRANCLERKVSGNLVEPEESAWVCVDLLRRQQVVRMDDESKKPTLAYCPVHYSQWENLFDGCRMDYFDAVIGCKR